MASFSDATREKKKVVYRKIDNSFEFFNGESMRNPVRFYSKPISKFKSSNITSNKFDEKSDNHYYINSDKRNNRRYNGEYGDYHGPKLYSYNDDVKNDYKADSGRPPGGSEATSENSNVVTPVILAREKNISEKKVQENISELNETESLKAETIPDPAPPKPYKIVSKVNLVEANITPEQNMVKSVKFLDESLFLGEDLSPFFLDQGNFLVIAVVGLQGAGKSMIASLLANPVDHLTYKNVESFIFPLENVDEVLSGCHTTIGTDIFVSKNRVIILDLQPLLSPSVMDFIVTQERKPSLDYSSTENQLEIESLQLLTFAMSVAHVLLVVQDCFLQPNIIRLLHTCQMMKPSLSSSLNSSGARDSLTRISTVESSDQPQQQHQQYFPHLVFVHNRCFSQHYSPSFIEELQNFYRFAMADSELRLGNEIGISGGSFSVPINSKTVKGRFNLFLIPDTNSEHKCCVSFRQSLLEMRRQIFQLTRCSLTHVSLTEKSWYQFSCRMWESIRKSNLFVEYSRHLP